MSFLDDIIDVGSSVWNMVTGPGTGAAIARATALGYLLKEVTGSINKDNQRPEAADTNKPDYGVREQVDPDTDHSIPVVYGTAFLGGTITDARLTNDNQVMYYCITLCERTGTLLSTGLPSQISFERIYWNQSEVIFKSDGITVEKLVDEDGNESTGVDGLIKIWCYNGSSSAATVPAGYTNANVPPAYNVFPEWTINHAMSDLVFAIVRVEYNRANQVTGLGNMEFKLKNTMTEAGDVLYDYMTNTRYGAGIVAEEINA